MSQASLRAGFCLLKLLTSLKLLKLMSLLVVSMQEWNMQEHAGIAYGEFLIEPLDLVGCPLRFASFHPDFLSLPEARFTKRTKAEKMVASFRKLNGK